MNRERGRERVSASEKGGESVQVRKEESERERAIFWQYKRNCACPPLKKTPLCSDKISDFGLTRS